MDSPYVRLMSLHILGPLQFQLQKFDCIILAFAELVRRGGRTYPIAGQVGHHDLFSLNEDYPLSYRDTCWGLPGLVPPYCVLLKYIEDIYFFEVNTKYISSSAVKKISIFHECVARVKMLIFSPHEMKYIWYLPKKVNFLFILYSTEIQKSQPYFLLGRFSFDLTFAACLLGITLNIVCT